MHFATKMLTDIFGKAKIDKKYKIFTKYTIKKKEITEK